MPDPREGESRKEFVSRCIPIVLKDGTAEDQDQANVPIEDQMKVIRREKERQERIDKEYKRRKEAAAREIIEGMKAFKDQRD